MFREGSSLENSVKSQTRQIYRQKHRQDGRQKCHQVAKFGTKTKVAESLPSNNHIYKIHFQCNVLFSILYVISCRRSSVDPYLNLTADLINVTDQVNCNIDILFPWR